MEINDDSLLKFSEETLNEMTAENVEGGKADTNKIPPPPKTNKLCATGCILVSPIE